MVTIPRAEINAITSRYGDRWPGGPDLAAEDVRDLAADLRTAKPVTWDEVRISNPAATDLPPSTAKLSAADDLDALVDRIDREAA